MEQKVLVSGRAAYIGSHMMQLLKIAGHAVMVADNFSTGFPDAKPGRDAHVVALVAVPSRQR